jgi:Protein kinase domain
VTATPLARRVSLTASIGTACATLPCVISAPDIPGYDVTGVCGRGGFGVVYRAWQRAVGREVAVKVDNRTLLTERDQRRFLREVTAAGRLSGHPNVIAVYDAGMLPDGRPYQVMELCPDGSLQDEIARHGPMRPARVRDLGAGLADALAAAHQAGVLHRDIKPANVLLNRYGHAGLSDFGLASLLDGAEGQSVTREALTPAYAPPEAFRASEPTAAGDVYSLAATLYALLAGAPPHVTPGEQAPAPVTFMLRRDLPPQDIPGVPPRLMAVLRQGLASVPADRPSAGAMRDAIAGALSEREGAGTPGEAVTPLSGPVPLGHTTPTVQVRSGHRAARRGPSPRAMLGLALGTVAVAAAAIAGVLIGQHAPGSASPATVTGTGHGGTGQSSLSGIGGTSSAAAIATTAPGADLAPGVYGIPVTSRNCPAALVRDGNARCPASPECWNGLVEISGNVTAARLPCSGPHVFQTFAIAILPAEAKTWDVSIVQADPAVMRVCSEQVMLLSRLPRARRHPASSWLVAVMPPDETQFENGARYYRCVAAPLGGATFSTSQFGALPQTSKHGSFSHSLILMGVIHPSYGEYWPVGPGLDEGWRGRTEPGQAG